MVSQFVRNEPKRTKVLLGELHPFPEGTMAIGRLDEKSEGLLLLTTDGKTSEQVRSSCVEKEYLVQVDGQVTQEAIKTLENGVEIGLEGKKYLTNPCKARILTTPPDLPKRQRKIRDARHGPTSWISITINEGKNRQVRKMTAAVGHPTLRLVRVRVGQIELGNMQPGEVKEVTALL